MNLITKFINLIAVPLSLGLSIIYILPRVGIAESPRRLQNWQISQKFIPPNRQAPRTTAGGGSRGDSCDLASNETLQPLIPQNKLGLTLAERPTLYWFVPQISVPTAHFSILDDKGIVYATTVKLPNKPGIIGFTLPSNAPSLKVGKQYHWYFAIACNPEEPEKEMTVDGWIERIQTTSALSQQLARTNPQQLSQVYANAGIWHEALHTLVKQRLANPNDRQSPAVGDLTVTANWQVLLESVGLKNLVSQPLINKYRENTQPPQHRHRCKP
ncbi:DUF928 domain-containing protein [Anabaena sp. UHCC 0399]|uniref:DUF928 domain-containing protein n=1 Tax=Anabaena sp. UHCC 0399 TaxID=3110238 RepID=UPI002B2099DF|nr:DUF928 domain-containing protein [Anabaena sp. UHCC 0399]MEA5568471.1 DUF928 domain-containing protein [Anabaena sp. UHCC 0399]